MSENNRVVAEDRLVHAWKTDDMRSTYGTLWCGEAWGDQDEPYNKPIRANSTQEWRRVLWCTRIPEESALPVTCMVCAAREGRQVD